MNFRYRCLERSGRPREGSLEAPSIADAERILQRRFLVVEQLTRSEHVEDPPARPRKLGRLPGEVLALLLRQFSTMLAAGIPIHRAVRLLDHDTHPRLGLLLDEVEARISSGWALSECLRRAGVIPPLVVNVLAAGEASGKLESVLEKLAQLSERSVRLQKKIVSTLAYPATLIFVSIAVVGLFVLYIVPQMQQIYVTIGGTLPLPTRMLIWAVRVAMNPLVWGSLGIALFVSIPLVRACLARPGFRVRVDRLILRLPVVGHLVEKVIAVRLLQALATTLDAGLSLTSQMSTLEGLAGNVVVEGRIRDCRERLEAGYGISEALEGSGVFSRIAVHMVRAGEESGNLVVMLQRTAALYEEEVEMVVSTSASLIEPLLLAGMGLVVGFIALAASLPIIGLLDQL